MRPDLVKAMHDLTFRMRLLKAGQEEQQVGKVCLTEREMLILELLAESGPMSVSKLSLADPDASDSTISSTITGLWRNKLVTKKISPENQRTTIIGLTETGRKMVEGFIKQREDRLQAFCEAINTTDDEEEVMLNVFTRAINFFDERLGIRTVASK
jgi:DNA-binding MarR family transcriptional regulator